MGRTPHLFVTALAFSALVLSICAMLALPAAARNAADPLERAENALQRHNYAIALDATNDYLKAFPDGPKATRARVIRALAKIGLKRFEEGVAEAEALLDEFAELAKDMELHEALAQVGEQRHDYRYLAVDHYEALTDLLLARGHREEAARAQLKRGMAFIRFTQWKKARSVDEAPTTDDWREARRLQRKYAVQCFDRAASLTSDDTFWAEILSAKARVFARDLRLDQEDVDTAIEVYQQIVERMPQTNEAAEALTEIGELYESRKHNYLQAAIVFRRVLKMPGIRDSITNRARQRLERIEAPSFRMSVESPVTPGEPLRLHWESRNIETISFSVYRVDLLELASDYDLRDVLDDEWKADGKIALHEWALHIPDERKHLVYRSGDEGFEPVSVPTTEPGAYVIVGEGEGLYRGDVRVVGLGLISNITALSYTGRERSLLWLVASDTGLPLAGATVHVYTGRGKERRLVREAETDDAGLLEHVRTLPRKPHRSNDLMYVVRQGEHCAFCSTHWQWWRADPAYRLYSFTDRPVYRPEQTVHFKHILRRSEEGRYENQPNRLLAIRIRDPKGEVVHEERRASNEFGTVAGDWSVPKKAPLGEYRMEIEVDGVTIAPYENSGARFRVEEYRKPEFAVTVSPGESSYRIGDTIEAAIHVRYYFGDPVPGAEVTYTVHRAPRWDIYRPPIPYLWMYEGVEPLTAVPDAEPAHRRWWMPHWAPRELVKTGTAITGPDGVAKVTIPSEAIEHSPGVDVRYFIEAEATDSSRRVITGAGSVVASHKPFDVFVNAQRNIYHPGDTVAVEITARDANDKPVAFTGNAEVYRLEREWKEDRYEYRLGSRVAEGRVDVKEIGSYRWVADEAGPFRVVVTADAKEEPEHLKPSGQCDVWIAAPGLRPDRFAYRDVELVFDKSAYRVGDTAEVLLTTRAENAYVLVTTQADELIAHQIVFIENGSKLIDFPITKQHVPNFYLSATVVNGGVIFQDQKHVVIPPVEQFLRVGIETEGTEFDAGAETTATLGVTDHQAEPAAAEVAVMVVDSSVYYIHPEYRGAIEQYFFGQLRPLAVHLSVSFRSDRGYGVRELKGVAQAPYRDGVFAMEAESIEQAATASRMRRGKLSGAGDMEESEEFAAPTVRKAFADAIVWIAQGRTDHDGRLNVHIPFSDDLTTWAMHAIAIDRDTRVGQASTELITTKDIIARLQTPRFLVEGDRAVLSVIAHNDREEAIEARVSLVAASSEITVGNPIVNGIPREYDEDGAIEVTVPAKSEVLVDFETIARFVGDCTLTATVAAVDGGDAVERTVPVIPYGAHKLLADGGSIRDGETLATRRVSMTLPEQMDPKSPLLEIHLSPSIASVMLDSLPYLLEYPYGCTEQTMSRFLPAVVTRKTLIDLGIDLQQIKTRIEDQGGPDIPAFERLKRAPVFSETVMGEMIQAGIARLEGMQKPDGGWGWWKYDASNPYMTAYVVYGLSEAAKADVSFDRAMLQRGVDFLRQRVVSPEPVGRYAWADRDDLNVRVWMLYALAEADLQAFDDAKVQAKLDLAFEERDWLTDYTRAMLALTLHLAGSGERAGIVIENLDNTVVVDEETGTVRWGAADGYWRWYNNGLEATAMALRAMLAIKPDHRYVPKAVNWIVRNRRGVHWRSTKDTAFAVYALADYLAATGELSPDMAVTVEVDGKTLRTFHIKKDNALTLDPELSVEAEALSPGPHTVTVSKKGTGNVYFSTYLSFYTKEDPITEAGNELYVKRSYSRLIPKEVEKTRRVWDETKQKMVDYAYREIEYEHQPLHPGETLAPRDLIEVRLDIDARNNFEYLMFIDPKPAGCEPVRLTSGAAYGDGVYSNVELRDREVTFFATYLSQGEKNLTYRLRCETPGTFHALPTIAQAMYAPFVRGNSASDVLKIEVD
jgi:uncharacterized protein YfaS (alpha-2-macroglobulin family)/tetratricopeptide (TPR) repeat protein